jgi:tetratricopeptide (TPR) repeat protein
MLPALGDQPSDEFSSKYLTMNQPSPDQLFAIALQHHQASRLAAAEALYRQILLSNPSHADALHMLGQVAHQVGQHGAAEELIRRAIAVNPSNVIYYGNLGQVLAALGRRSEEIEAYRKIIALRTDLPEGYYNLGIALAEAKRHEESIAAYRRALDLRPDYYEALTNLAGLLGKQEQYQEAVALYRRALALHADAADAHYNLATTLDAMGDTTAAIAEFQEALKLQPRHVEALTNLGKALIDAGRPDDAMAASSQAIALAPNLPLAHVNAAISLLARENFDDALASLRRAATLAPDHAQVLNTLGNVLRMRGEIDEALDLHRRAKDADPQSANAEFSLGYLQLLRGNYEDGWRGYEARGKIKGIVQKVIPGPMWDGSDLAGKRIVVHYDQGLGDTLQFVRFVPQIKSRRGHVILYCQDSLRRLLQGQCEVDQVIDSEQSLPQYDLRVPISSLPYLLKTTLATIPAQVPYLTPDPALVEHWRQRLQGDSRLKVGLAWAGNPNRMGDRERSMQLQTLAPLAQVPNARFFSLQKGPAAAQAIAPPPGMDLVDWSEQLTDFADTAALVANLDLIITVDTAAAHLAGALARPTWVMLQLSPDWRWLLDRTDSPWYPTATLFRQPAFGAWDQVVKKLPHSLAALCDQN